MGLIGENCRSCRSAAEAQDGGGLAGSWWRGWAKVCAHLILHVGFNNVAFIILKANQNSGYIGAAVVGGFLAIVGGWYTYRWGTRKMKGRRK